MRKICFLSLLVCTGVFSANAQETAFVGNDIEMNIAFEKTGIIKGRITTTDGKPAEMVNINLKNSGKNTMTDKNGFFILKNIKEGSHTLIVSMIGLETQEKQVFVKSAETTTIDISLTENQQQLSEIIITSTKGLNNKPVAIGKIAIDPMDLPQGISIIGQGLINDQQAQRLSDVIKNVNGVYLGTSRGSVQESFYARGYSFSNSNLFKNGARINPGVMPEMGALERVEVLKGSAAILFGQVAPGGIVNMITKQPKFQFGGEIAMRAGSYDLYKPSFDIYGPINSTIAYRVNGSYESSQSFRDHVGSERYYVNPSFLFKLSNRTEIVVEGDYLKHEFTPDFGIGSLDNTKIPDVPRSRFLGAAWSYNTTQQATTTTSLKHRFNDVWSLNAFASYQLYKRDYYSTERIQANAAGQWARPLGRINTDEDYYVGQVDLNGKFKTKSIEHNLLAGADADRYYTTTYGFNQPATYDTINILDLSKYQQRTDMPDAQKTRVSHTPINRFGVYVQDLIKLSSKFNILAGVRWTHLETIRPDTTIYATKVKMAGQTKIENAFSPRFGLVYKPLPTTSVFVSYSNSFQTNTGIDIYNQPLPASVIDQYEVGVKNDFFKGLLSANLTVYRIVNSNLAQMAPMYNGRENSNSSIKVLAGETTSDGVELDIASHPISGLSVIAGYSYNYMRFTNTSGEKGSNIEGERLVNTPAHTANTSIFYTFSSTKLKGIKIGATANYTGDRFGGWNNTVLQAQNYSRLIPVEGFTTVDVSAGYTYKKVSLLAKVSNLTNTFNYYVHENYSINPIPPRQFIATVAYKL
ncbi:TonB-dependent receptor [Chitinophagaceae bacterium LB-8]|uniref:TonB-dependent receptor n=1 Tax=Paraflavisolibacter caeni TaxID=2982496 RepID=A0A9X2Y114_9BACT|nr:TonB-dependent receptor [Paraflavisolibacter caeni]MCU7552730.1 TonB-dependent receptor [Paraflavisolibacter caeni]